MKKENKYMLRVGFGRSNIMPLESVMLGGCGGVEGTRMHERVLDELEAITIAVTDENEETALFVVCDLVAFESLAGIIEPIEQATGIDRSHIFVAATHTHNAPGLTAVMEQTDRYRAYLGAKVAVAAAQAMADRKPATMQITSAMTENMTFCRRYMNSEGKLFRNFQGMTMVGPESPPDEQLQMLKFVREGGKDILLVNFQGHYHGESTIPENYKSISRNYMGACRDYLEEKTGCYAAYFAGAGGNLAVQTIYDKPRNVSTGYVDHGQRLAKYALDAQKDFRPVKAGPIRIKSRVYTGRTKKQPELFEIAEKMCEYFEATNDKEGTMALAKGYPISNVFHAGAIHANSKLGDTFDTTLEAVTIGDLAIACAPCEMYDANGKAVKEQSPFGATLVFQLCNGSVGYIPAEYAYANGGYEIETTKFQKGVAEGFQNTFLDLFKEMKEEQNYEQ